MLRVVKFVLLVALFASIQCSPFDDGKYSPGKYRVYDDGKYYRPLSEGKYIPGDEGRYTYIYRQGLYPSDDGDYRYIHQTGPNGGFGGEGGFGGNGGTGGFGPDGPNGPGGPGGPGGPAGPGGPPRENKYIGKQIYAKRYPYIHKVIKSLVDKYVSGNSFGEDFDSSINHYRKVYADKNIPVKCRYMIPNNTTEFTTQYPPTVNIPDGENFGSYYSFRGSKLLSDSITGKLKLEYEVFVRVVEVNN